MVCRCSPYGSGVPGYPLYRTPLDRILSVGVPSILWGRIRAAGPKEQVRVVQDVCAQPIWSQSLYSVFGSGLAERYMMYSTHVGIIYEDQVCWLGSQYPRVAREMMCIQPSFSFFSFRFGLVIAGRWSLS